MAQKHKHSYFKSFGSKCRTPETPSISIKDSVTNNGSVTKESSDSNGVEEPKQIDNRPTGGFRNFFRKFPFRGGFHKKTKVQSSKKRKEPNNDTPLDADEVRQLIAMFSKYENLYNPKSSQYGNKQIESIYYADMARSFPNRTGTQLQAYINELRSSFEREHSIIESVRRSSGEILKPSIEYYMEFLFLIPFLNLSRNRSHALTPSVSVVSIGPTDHSLNIPKDVRGNPITMYGLGHRNQKLYKSDNLKFAKYAVEAQAPLTRASLKGGQQAEDEPEPSQDQAQPLQEAQEPEVKTENQTPQSQLNPQPETNTENKNSQTEPEAMASCGCPRTPINAAPTMKMEPCRCKRSTSQRHQLQPQANVNGNYQCPQTGPQVNKNSANSNTVHSAPLGNYACKRPGQCQGPCIKCSPKNSFAMNQGSVQRSPANARRAPEQRGRSPNSFGGNGQQVQLLCDMIRAELSSAPDFIYYDAKWRIIEILREVNKRQMIHKKGEPSNCGLRPNGSVPSPPNAQKFPVVRDCHLQANSCPYCPSGYKG